MSAAASLSSRPSEYAAVRLTKDDAVSIPFRLGSLKEFAEAARSKEIGLRIQRAGIRYSGRDNHEDVAKSGASGVVVGSLEDSAPEP